MTRGQHLRDHAAERGAEDMGALVAERGDQRGRIVGQFFEAIGRRWIPRAAGIALVIGDDGEIIRQQRAEGIEHGMIGFRAVQAAAAAVPCRCA